MAPTPTITENGSSLNLGEQQAFREMAASFHKSAAEPSVQPGVEHDLVSQSPQQLAKFQSSESKVAGFFSNVKSKFTKKEIFGSLFVFLYVGNQFNTVRMGMKNNEMTPDGELKPAPDIGRILNALMNMVISGWTFFSNRSAMVPEGNNALQRGKYALENMDKSQVQVRDILALSGGMASMVEHFVKGGKLAQKLENRKLVKAGEKPQEIEYDNTRLAQGVLSIIGNSLTVYALLGPEAARKKRKEEIKHEESANKLANFELRPFKEAKSLPLKGRIKENIKTIGRFLKDNPMLMLNSAVSLSIAIALNIEGQKKRKEQTNMFGKVDDFKQSVPITMGKKNPKEVDASVQLFKSLFGTKEINDKINVLANKYGIKPDKKTPEGFLAAFRGNDAAMKDLNALIPQGKKVLGEAGSRAIKSSVMGIILNFWGLTFRAQQVLREDKMALGVSR